MKVQEKKNKLSGCHVVVVGDARAELLFCQYKSTDFFTVLVAVAVVVV